MAEVSWLNGNTSFQDRYFLTKELQAKMLLIVRLYLFWRVDAGILQLVTRFLFQA